MVSWMYSISWVYWLILLLLILFILWIFYGKRKTPTASLGEIKSDKSNNEGDNLDEKIESKQQRTTNRETESSNQSPTNREIASPNRSSTNRETESPNQSPTNREIESPNQSSTNREIEAPDQSITNISREHYNDDNREEICYKDCGYEEDITIINNKEEEITKVNNEETGNNNNNEVTMKENKEIDNTPKIPEEIVKKQPKKNYRNKKMNEIKPPISGRSDFRSRGEAICCQILEEIYGKPFRKIRPDFLKNPETGYNLEIDCYNEDLKLGCEFNGVQHYCHPNYTGSSLEEFIKQVRRDQFKVDMCDLNGVYLITVPYNVPENLIRDYIIHYLPENVQARLDAAKNNQDTS